MLEKHLTIREWSEDDRPREKMLKKGIEALSNVELLAILLRTGNKDETAVELSRRILSNCQNNLNELALLSVNELAKSYKGIGITKAITIKAALEFGKRRKIEEFVEQKQITSSLDFHELFKPILFDLQHEEFWIARLDGSNKLIDTKRLTQGGRQQTTVDIADLLKSALERNAISIAVAHNHPSGNKYPSEDDKKITTKIKTGCEAIGIRLLDHIIIAKNQYYSFADEGLI